MTALNPVLLSNPSLLPLYTHHLLSSQEAFQSTPLTFSKSVLEFYFYLLVPRLMQFYRTLKQAPHTYTPLKHILIANVSMFLSFALTSKSPNDYRYSTKFYIKKFFSENVCFTLECSFLANRDGGSCTIVSMVCLRLCHVGSVIIFVCVL